LNFGQVDSETPNWLADIAFKNSRLKRFKMRLRDDALIGHTLPQ